MKPIALLPLTLAVLSTLALPVRAQSLSDFYQAALSHDAALQAARQTDRAALARAEQAQAGLRPSAALSAGVNRNAVSSDVTALDRGAFGNQSLSLSAKQALYNPASQASADQGQRLAALAHAQLQQAEQDLIVRVSQAYFDVLAAQDTLRLVRTQKAAVVEQLAAAQRNFEVGTATITDTREAQARHDLTLAQEIAADNDLRVKRLALEQLSGLTKAQPKPLPAASTLSAPQPANLQAWVDQALAQHPGLTQAQLGLDIARLETRKAQAAQRPTLDLTGAYSVTQNNGSASTLLDYRSNVASLGLSLNWPLYTGGAVHNRIQETLALEEKAQADLLAAQRNIGQATRAAYLGVQSGLGQVGALQAASASAQSALEATQLGYQVGVRVNVDVLNAQTALYDTQTRLAKARYDVLLGGIKLRQANGSLTAADLQAVNALLSH